MQVVVWGVVLLFGFLSVSPVVLSDANNGGAASEVKSDKAEIRWEFSIRDAAGKPLRSAKMSAEGTAALRDKERGSCMYKFLRKQNDAAGKVKYSVEESCAVTEEQARGNATVSNTHVYECVAAPDAFNRDGVQSCAATVDSRTGKQFHCECHLLLTKGATPSAKNKL